MKVFLNDIKSLIGLFLPMPFYKIGVSKGILTNKKICWGFTMTIGHIPLGWIIIIISWLIK